MRPLGIIITVCILHNVIALFSLIWLSFCDNYEVMSGHHAFFKARRLRLVHSRSRTQNKSPRLWGDLGCVPEVSLTRGIKPCAKNYITWLPTGPGWTTVATANQNKFVTLITYFSALSFCVARGHATLLPKSSFCESLHKFGR